MLRRRRRQRRDDPGEGTELDEVALALLGDGRDLEDLPARHRLLGRAHAVALAAEGDACGRDRRSRSGAESGRAANWLGLLRAAMRAPPIRKVEARPVRIVPQSQRMLTVRRTGCSSSPPTRSGGSVPRSIAPPRAPMFRPVRPLTCRLLPDRRAPAEGLAERPLTRLAGGRRLSHPDRRPGPCGPCLRTRRSLAAFLALIRPG